MADLSHQSRDVRRGASGVNVDDTGMREAIRTGIGVAAVGLMFLLVADAWIGTCTGSLAQAAGCGVPQRAILALGSPAILLGGAVWSLVRAMQSRGEQTAWWAWLGAWWSLLGLVVLSAVLSLPSLPLR